MSGITRETAALHGHIASTVQQQLDGFAQRFESRTGAWVDTLGTQLAKQDSERLAAWAELVQRALPGADAFGQRGIRDLQPLGMGAFSEHRNDILGQAHRIETGTLDALLARLVTGLGEAFDAERPDRVLVHGDTHFFKVDKPLYSPAKLLPNLTRLQTFGSPSLHWVKVGVEPGSAHLFNIQPVIVRQP